MNNWDQITIGEAVEIGLLEKPLDGNHGEIHPKGDDFVDSGTPFIMASDIKNGKVDLENCSYITNSQAQSLRKGFSINGDVLLTHKATLGEVALLKTNYEFVMLTPQVTYYRVKDKEKLNNSFLKYYFESSFFQKTLHNYAGGSTRAYIGITKQLDLPLILPPLQEQKAIAKVLTAFDDKIELLQAQNKTLESMAQTIFKEWFGKYQIGDELPEGWRVGRLKDLGNIICGKTPSKADNENFGGNIPFIKIPDMHNQMFIITTTDSLTKKGVSLQKNKLIPKNSICVSCIATVGLVSITSKDSQTNQQINSIIPFNDSYKEFIFFKVKGLNKYLHDIGSGGTATLNVNTTSFSNIEIVIPDAKKLYSFSKIANPIFKKVLDNNSQIQSLTKTRDTLLPKLMSGQVRVNNIKQTADA